LKASTVDLKVLKFTWTACLFK